MLIRGHNMILLSNRVYFPPSKKIAFISDTQMGGITEDLVAVNKTFEIIESQNIDTIFHLGDLVDGPINYSTRQV
jgi:predicted phosphodiesterase